MWLWFYMRSIKKKNLRIYMLSIQVNFACNEQRTSMMISQYWIMSWWRQATGHYLNHCWPRCLSLYCPMVLLSNDQKTLENNHKKQEFIWWILINRIYWLLLANISSVSFIKTEEACITETTPLDRTPLDNWGALSLRVYPHHLWAY